MKKASDPPRGLPAEFEPPNPPPAHANFFLIYSHATTSISNAVIYLNVRHRQVNNNETLYYH